MVQQSQHKLRRKASTAQIQQLVLLVAAGAMYFANLGTAGLWDADEPIYSSIARDMAACGDWVVPRYNAAVWCEKPPMMFWLMMGSFKFLGTNELAARLPAALLAIGTALATYHLGRRLFSANVGFWAGLVVTSNVIFTVSARAATVDMALTCATTLVMLLFVIGARWEEPGSYAPKSRLIYLAIGALLGASILAKGPIGFLLPAAALGLFLLVMNTEPREDAVAPTDSRVGFRLFSAARRIAALFAPRCFLRTFWSMRPLTVLLTAALVAGPWFALVTLRTDGEWLQQFIMKFNARPFNQPFLGHAGPFYYHFVVVLAGLFPWSIFAGPTVTNAWRSLRSGGREKPSYVFLLCWVGVFFGFWSICSTKLPHYVLPAYPALAILTACFLDAWLKQSDAAPRFAMPTATGILCLVGALMFAILPFVTARYAPGESIIALSGLELLLGGAAAMYFLLRGRRPAYLAAVAATSVFFIVVLFAWAAVRIDQHQHSRPLMAALYHDSPTAPQIAGYKYCDASTIYYAGGPVATIAAAADLRRFVRQSTCPYVVTTGDGYRELDRETPGAWRVVARRPRFLSKGEIIVLSPRGSASDLTSSALQTTPSARGTLSLR